MDTKVVCAVVPNPEVIQVQVSLIYTSHYAVESFIYRLLKDTVFF
jgi:hypothetical protein